MKLYKILEPVSFSVDGKTVTDCQPGQFAFIPSQFVEGMGSSITDEYDPAEVPAMEAPTDYGWKAPEKKEAPAAPENKDAGAAPENKKPKPKRKPRAKRKTTK